MSINRNWRRREGVVSTAQQNKVSIPLPPIVPKLELGNEGNTLHRVPKLQLGNTTGHLDLVPKLQLGNTRVQKLQLDLVPKLQLGNTRVQKLQLRFP